MPIADFQVDHIIPESLLKRPQELADVLDSYGLPQDFDLHSFSNWLPACSRCNRKKSSRIFSPTPIVQVYLQEASDNSEKVREAYNRRLSEQEIGRVLATLTKAAENNQLSDDHFEIITSISKYRSPQDNILITKSRYIPYSRVLKNDRNISIIEGPYGVGGGPSLERIDEGQQVPCFVCESCHFNGTRCVTCGNSNDFDY